jgi:hypothetical protein
MECLLNGNFGEMGNDPAFVESRAANSPSEEVQCDHAGSIAPEGAGALRCGNA